MANATKNARTIISSASLSAGNTASGSVSLTTALGLLITVRITNGSTGPTVAPTVSINVSTDNSTWRLLTSSQSQTGNSVTTDFSFLVPPEAIYAQVSITGNTAQAVTVEAFGHELTSVG